MWPRLDETLKINFTREMSIPVSVSLKEDAPGHNKDDLDLQGPICWKCKGKGLSRFKKEM